MPRIWPKSESCRSLRSFAICGRSSMRTFPSRPPSSCAGPAETATRSTTKGTWRTRRGRRLGRSLTGRVLMVAYTVRGVSDDEKIRIIIARWASRKERAAYAGGAAD